MARKQRAHRTGKGIETAAPEQLQDILLNLVQSHQGAKLAPWQRPAIKPWHMVQTLARELQTALLECPGDSELTAALGHALDISKLDSIRESADLTGTKQRQYLNEQLAARWAALLDEVEPLAKTHSLPLYGALVAAKKQQATSDTPEQK